MIFIQVRCGLTYSQIIRNTSGSPDENAAELEALLKGEKSAYRDAVLLNASAALMIAGKCDTLKDGVEYSVESIDSGKANEALEIVKKVSNGEL